MNRLIVESLRYHTFGPVDLTVDAGECVTVMGPSGSGKSLMLRAIVDLDPHEGAVSLNGAGQCDMDAPSWRQRVALLPAESQWWDDTVGGHFADPPERLYELLERVGFGREVLGWEVARLSTGERQRIALARMLLREPLALLLDEPTASLDRDNVERVEHIVEEYRREHGAPVIWVSHDEEQAARVGDRMCRIRDGRLIEEARR